jgi:3,4-dihydroxyphenylacetate 2,3-dioxygenase
MPGGIYRCVVVPHAPRLGFRDQAPPFGLPLIDGCIALGEDVRRDTPKPDLIVVNSTHFVSTFNWQALVQPEHKGHCVAEEAPDLIGGVPYHYKGDPVFARAMKDEINALGYPCVENASPHYSWDYGTWVPVHYMDPKAEIPVVSIPTVLSSDLDECFKVGGAIHRAAQKTGKRVLFAASSSFTHKLVRGPHIWPTPERIEADRKFIDLLLDGRIDEAWKSFPHYTQFVVGEMGGRVIALFLGATHAMGAKKIEGKTFGTYGQSSGSGNHNVSLKMAA